MVAALILVFEPDELLVLKDSEQLSTLFIVDEALLHDGDGLAFKLDQPLLRETGDPVWIGERFELKRTRGNRPRRIGLRHPVDVVGCERDVASAARFRKQGAEQLPETLEPSFGPAALATA